MTASPAEGGPGATEPCRRPPLILLILKEYFFVISLLLAVPLGLWLRGAASELAEYRSLLLFSVMFLLGLEQRVGALAVQLRKVGAITLSVSLSFIVFPPLAWVVGQWAVGGGEALAGFVVLGAVPTTLTSAVIYTRLDRGNDRLALVIVLVSQVLAVLVTPALIEFFLGRSTPLPFLPMVQKLFLYFLLPLALGMLIAPLLPTERIKPYLARPEQLVVALFVFMGAGHIPADTGWALLGKTFGGVILLQMSFVVLVRWLIKRFVPWDQTALFYTATQKTLSVGLYLLLSYFPNTAILPMVLYHLLQLTIGRFYWLPPQWKRRSMSKG